MSFFGKKFKKVKAENAAEFIGKLNLSEKVIAMLRNPDSITTFTKNADGTITYLNTDSAGNVALDQKIQLDTVVDYKIPDGSDAKVKFSLEGEVLKSHMVLPDGKDVYLDTLKQIA